MAYGKRPSKPTTRLHRNQNNVYVGTILLSLFVGVLLLLHYFHTGEMLGEQGLPLALLTSFLGLSGSVLGQACVPEIIRSSPPTNDQLEVALSRYSYCGGTLNVKV